MKNRVLLKDITMPTLYREEDHTYKNFVVIESKRDVCADIIGALEGPTYLFLPFESRECQHRKREFINSLSYSEKISLLDSEVAQKAEHFIRSTYFLSSDYIVSENDILYHLFPDNNFYETGCEREKLIQKVLDFKISDLMTFCNFFELNTSYYHRNSSLISFPRLLFRQGVNPDAYINPFNSKLDRKRFSSLISDNFSFNLDIGYFYIQTSRRYYTGRCLDTGNYFTIIFQDFSQNLTYIKDFVDFVVNRIFCVSRSLCDTKFLMGFEQGIEQCFVYKEGNHNQYFNVGVNDLTAGRSSFHRFVRQIECHQARDFINRFSRCSIT